MEDRIDGLQHVHFTNLLSSAPGKDLALPWRGAAATNRTVRTPRAETALSRRCRSDEKDVAVAGLNMFLHVLTCFMKLNAFAIKILKHVFNLPLQR